MPYEGFQQLDAATHRDLKGRQVAPWGRRILLTALIALVVLALLNVLGQHDTRSSASSGSGALLVSAPRTLRGGLMYQARFTLTAPASHALNHPTLVLDSGWFDGMTFNGAVPDPTQQFDVGGRVAMEFDRLGAGQSSTAWLSFQVNPTTIGSRATDVELEDGQSVVARIHRTLTVLP